MTFRSVPVKLLAAGVALFGATAALATAEKLPAAEKTAGLITIGAIDGESDSKMSVINIRLDKQPAFTQVAELQDHGSFLQLVIPNAVVPEPGKFFDGNNPYLPKVAVFQLTPTDAAVRLFANSDASAIKRASQAEILGNRIVLTVDHARVASGVPAPRPFVGPPAPEELRPKVTVAADDVIAKTAVSHDIPAPAAQIKKDSFATGGIDLRDKLVRVAIFSGIMLLALVASFFARPLLRRRAAARQEAEPQVTMRTLSSMALAPRQKVSLIQVGDEKFLIGVTPDAVTFLTPVGKSTAVPAMARAPHFARALEESAQAPVEMRAAPVLKKLPGNDEATLAAPAPKRETPVAEAVPAKREAAPRQRINLTVGDDGVKTLDSRPAPRTTKQIAGDDSQKAIDDVTRLIREKLKTLRTI